MIGPGVLVSGKYRIIRLVGDGGMGSVYEAQHEVLGTRVAIKVLHPELLRRTGLVERFLQEARVVAKIRSPHVVQVIDVDRTPDTGDAYIVMELLEGEPLASVIERVRKLPAPTACDYATQILEALEAAHSLGVIHRDLKPDNVFVTFVAAKPVLKLIDFGIAKLRAAEDGIVRKNLTVAGAVMGTAEYMAPEQARSAGEVDARADLYAVGVMLYEMLSGLRPVNGDDARILALKVERGEVVPLVQAAPDVPRELAGLVHRAMAPRPELRFPTATEMRLALAAVMSGKKAPTAALAAVGAAGRTGAMPIAGAPPPGDLGTGTLKGENARDVYANGTPANVGSPQPVAGATNFAPPPDMSEPHVDTVRAPPTNVAMQAYQVPMQQPPMQGGYAPPPQARRRKGNGAKIALLVAIPLLLGVGSVAAYVAYFAPPDTPPPPPPPTAIAPTAKPGASPSGAPTPPPADTLAPLAPIPVKPTPGGPQPNGPKPQPRETDGGAGPSPTTPFIPPIPSVFPLPSGLPTVWPTALPSAFPFPLPQPPKTQAPSAPTDGPGY